MLSSIRWRLQAWHGLILVAVLCGFGISAYHVAETAQLQSVDQELEERLAGLFRPWPRDRPPGAGLDPREPELQRGIPPSQPKGVPAGEARRPRAWPSDDGPRPPGRFDVRTRLRQALERDDPFGDTEGAGFYTVVWEVDSGRLFARSANAPADVPMPDHDSLAEARRPAPRLGPGPVPFPTQARGRGERRELSVVLPERLTVLVGRSISGERSAMRKLALGLAAAGAAILLLGLAGGSWLASRAIRPIDDISATALRIAGGDLSRRIDTADTETELGRLANVLNTTFARLEAAFAQQAQFTSDASHELRTPLAVILSQTQGALARERPAHEYREALEACQRAADRMRRLSESLLQLARLDAGAEPMEMGPCDLARIAREAVELVRPLASARDIQVVADLANAPCRGDSLGLSNVVVNLLTNAIDFSHAGGTVRITTSAGTDGAVLLVSDEGLGIPTEDLPHVFERFYRADRSRSAARGRTGLGLAIAKAIVDAHSGTIEAASRHGAGSTFAVRLPGPGVL